VAGASEPSSYAWTLSFSASWSVAIRVFSGVDNADVWDVTPSASTLDSGTSLVDPFTMTAPSMTTSNDDAMGILWALSDSQTRTFESPTNGYGTELETSAQAQASYIRVWETAGVTGASSVNLTFTDDFVIHQIALKAAAVSAGNPWNYYAQQ